MHFQTTDGDESLRESVGDGAELIRAVRISLCGLDLKRVASFVPATSATADFDWQNWLRKDFAQGLGDAFVEIYRAAGQMQVRELMEVDATLDNGASRAAGGALLERLTEAKSLRSVDRMRVILGDGGQPHFATAFAVECAEFHLPLRSALVSYLYGEWRCGMSSIGGRGGVEVFAAASGGALEEVVHEVLSKGASPFENVAGL